MKKLSVVLMSLTLIILQSGCGKPPKDVAQKMAYNYMESRGGGLLEPGDIKYLGAVSKDGGYLVNIQAGDALCEMQMIKNEKEWMAKGISCNGSFLSNEKAAERKKAAVTKRIQKAVEETKNKEIALDNGTTYKFILEGKRVAMVFNTHEPANMADSQIKDGAKLFKQTLCDDKDFKNARSVGYETGMDFVSKDNAPLMSVTVKATDCGDSI